MPDRSRRVLLGRAGGAAGLLLLGVRPTVRAEQPGRSTIAISGLDVAGLAPFDELMTAFVEAERVPGAALAVSRASRLVYARGFGLADRERGQPVQPVALFRIASISKPVTAVAVLQLAERSKLALEAGVWDVLGLGEPADGRWKQVTIRHLLQHTGGWDSQQGFDPMFRAPEVARALNVSPPVEPRHVIRCMLRQPLDFDPGTRFAYSNFGYCLLGRVIERASGTPYESYVQREVLAPLGIRRMRLGKTTPAQRAPDEVAYYAESGRADPADPTSRTRKPAPLGAWSLEVMDSHGGWLASAPDLARFASAFDEPAACKVLRPESIARMFARPDGPAGYETGGTPKAVYYGCGWRVRSAGPPGRVNTWHTGSLDGTSTLLVRRHDGSNWAVLFNARNAPDGRRLSDKIDPLIHRAADRVRNWPDRDQFARLL